MTILETIRSNVDNKEKANFVNLVAVALADGHISHEEYDELYLVGKKFGASPDEVDQIIQSHNELSFEAPKEMVDKQIQLISLIRMMWADGVMDERELVFVNSFCVGLGFDTNESKRLVQAISNFVLEDHSDKEIIGML